LYFLFINNIKTIEVGTKTPIILPQQHIPQASSIKNIKVSVP
jgi:hypothetical protein